MSDDLILMGRRILEKEAQALAGFVQTLDDRFSEVCKKVVACKGTVLLTGIGKSGLVARKWSATLSGTGTPSYFINPAEASHGDLGIVRKEDLVIALSYSGETDELSYVLRHARENDIPTVAVTGNPNSSLARQSQTVLSVQLSEEACPLGLAPTSSTTLMMAVGDAIAMTVMQMRGFTENDFARLHPGGALGRKLWLRVSELMHRGDAIPRIQANDTLEKVLSVMTQKYLGLAVVTEGEAVTGIITDGDLRRFFQRWRGSTVEAKAKDVMSAHPKTISEDALAIEARELMERNSIHHLLILDKDQKLVGVVHFLDLLRRKVL